MIDLIDVSKSYGKGPSGCESCESARGTRVNLSSLWEAADPVKTTLVKLLMKGAGTAPAAR